MRNILTILIVAWAYIIVTKHGVAGFQSAVRVVTKKSNDWFGGGSGGSCWRCPSYRIIRRHHEALQPKTTIAPLQQALKNVVDAPPLQRHPSRKICLMVEPTPFTHVSGYANRFKEMLKFLKKAGDKVDILTVDSKTPAKDLPKQHQGYPIRHTQGFTFPLYNHISLTIDLPEMKGAKIIENFKPDLIHVTSPGFLVFAAMFYARVMKIPLVMSYHTHLPSYGAFLITFYGCCYLCTGLVGAKVMCIYHF